MERYELACSFFIYGFLRANVWIVTCSLYSEIERIGTHLSIINVLIKHTLVLL